MEEIWRDIIIEKNGIIYDYSGLYQVSNLGRVKSLGNNKKRKERILKLKPGKSGYIIAALCKNGEIQRFSIHRLVATAFVPNPNNLPIVNHRDENPSNCNVDNLEWCDAKYNVNYGTGRKRASEKTKGQKRSEETKKKIGEAQKGQKRSEESKKRMSEAQKVKVVCLETQQVFNSIGEAQGWLGNGSVAHCLRGKCKTAGGLHWMYLEDYKREQRLKSDVKNSSNKSKKLHLHLEYFIN